MTLLRFWRQPYCIENGLEIMEAERLSEQRRGPFRWRQTGVVLPPAQGKGRDSKRGTIADQTGLMARFEHEVGNNYVDRMGCQRARCFDRISATLYYMTAIGKNSGEELADKLIRLSKQNA